MEEIIITALIGWIITKSLNKKEAQAAADVSTTLTPGYSQKLGKVIKPWPSAINSPGELVQLFSVDENTIYPGAVCQWPQKYQVRDMILRSFAYENELIVKLQQLSQADRDSRLGDDLLDEINEQKKTRKQLYQNLVMACGSYQAGSGGGSANQTSAQGRTFSP